MLPRAHRVVAHRRLEPADSLDYFPTPPWATRALFVFVLGRRGFERLTVEDPYCGCGTTIEAAEKLGRQWIGIDVSYHAVRLVERRLQSNVDKSLQVEIGGIPFDQASAEALATANPYGFQQWAVGELGCQLWKQGKRGADTGIDGEMWFYGGPNKTGKLLVQVKGGRRVGPDRVREFLHVMSREEADLGIFFMRGEPSADMKREAAAAGVFRIGSRTYPRLQIVTLEAWFSGQEPALPPPLPLRVSADRSRGKERRSRPDPLQPEFAFVVEGDLSQKSNWLVNPQLVPADMLQERDRKSARDVG